MCKKLLWANRSTPVFKIVIKSVPREEKLYCCACCDREGPDHIKSRLKGWGARNRSVGASVQHFRQRVMSHGSIQGLNLSLDQHLPPHGRAVPTSAGGFLKYPSKIRSLREPVDITRTTNGSSTRLILDLGGGRAQSPGEGKRVRESLEKLTVDRPSATSIIFDPTSSQIVQHFQNKATKRLTGPPSLIGGAGFSQVLQKRNLDALAYARMRRSDVGVSTEPVFVKLDLSDLADYQRWSKGDCEPFLKELRQALLANRPENIAEFVAAWATSICSNQPPPKAWLPGEREAQARAAEAAEEAALMEASEREAEGPPSP